ncbi:hypothetical protein CORC01_01504 [Colletotrichum orchidophilum]|uniref:Uncharacterized protein n=1 Tax=Colletotrichum orchidophilum TaxID=1209926 RepID=A0A1G4BNU0_9PEZI|nr:uncharacterized protein CORC01_01504 [Colletotrichum orchidophilum]OHF03120.1 hypothetical protein CORC01_01504 [Colletotrichum orchidophilum]
MYESSLHEKENRRRSPEHEGQQKSAQDTNDKHRWWSSEQLQYIPLDDSGVKGDAEDIWAQELRRSKSSLWRWRCATALLSVALIASCLPVFTPRSIREGYPQPEEGEENNLKWIKEAEVAQGHFWCGNSTLEAKRRGCAFNKLHNRWMHPACRHDFEYARRAVFEALGLGEDEKPTFHFYRDDDGKPGAEISDDELDRSEILMPAWTTVGHHMTHCMYLLLQAAAALNLGTKADMVVHAWEHAKHCATVVLNETKKAPAWNEVASFGHTQSGVCW